MAFSTVEGGLPSEVNDLLVSPRPCRRMRMLTGEPEEGGTMSRVREEGKSAFVGRRGRVAILGIALSWVFEFDIDVLHIKEGSISDLRGEVNGI